MIIYNCQEEEKEKTSQKNLKNLLTPSTKSAIIKMYSRGIGKQEASHLLDTPSWVTKKN